MRTSVLAAALFAAGLATSAQAQQGDDLCSDRPGLTSDPCLNEPGQVSLETSLADWTLDRQRGDREDTILFGDSLLRFGVAKGIELDLGWTPAGYDRTREDGEVTRATRVGDITVGARATLLDAPDGHGLSASVVGNVMLPAGRRPIGNGTWGAEIYIASAYEISSSFELQLTPEIDAAPDDDGDGRHVRYGAAVEAEFDLAKAVRLDIGGQVLRDRDPDPEERGTLALANVALAVTPGKRTQLDLGVNAGLNAFSPDVQVIAGFTRRF